MFFNWREKNSQSILETITVVQKKTYVLSPSNAKIDKYIYKCVYAWNIWRLSQGFEWQYIFSISRIVLCDLANTKTTVFGTVSSFLQIPSLQSLDRQIPNFSFLRRGPGIIVFGNLYLIVCRKILVILSKFILLIPVLKYVVLANSTVFELFYLLFRMAAYSLFT